VSDAPDSSQPPSLLTQRVTEAQSGLRRHVEAMMAAFSEAELLVPLARDLPEAPEGERVEFDGELTLVPHLLPDAEGKLFSALFTNPDPLEPIVAALGWTTSDEPLKVCAFPARIALEMALDVIDEHNVLGLVIDAGSVSELCLTRSELASILAGRALPLVGYVGDIPDDDQSRTLVAEMGPLPEALLGKLASWAESAPEVRSHRLDRTFNADRDLEPHLSLTLEVGAEADRRALFQSVTEAVEDSLPPPGYLDVLFVGARDPA
jgi:hypothetical protein